MSALHKQAEPKILPAQQFEFFTVWVPIKGKHEKLVTRFTRPDVALQMARQLNEHEAEQEERQGYCEGRYFVWSEPAGMRVRA